MSPTRVYDSCYMLRVVPLKPSDGALCRPSQNARIQGHTCDNACSPARVTADIDLSAQALGAPGHARQTIAAGGVRTTGGRESTPVIVHMQANLSIGVKESEANFRC